MDPSSYCRSLCLFADQWNLEWAVLPPFTLLCIWSMGLFRAAQQIEHSLVNYVTNHLEEESWKLNQLELFELY